MGIPYFFLPNGQAVYGPSPGDNEASSLQKINALLLAIVQNGSSSSGSSTLSQSLATGVDSVTFSLAQFEFAQAPVNIIPTIIRSSGGSSGIIPLPRQWTSLSFTCDLTSPTDDDTFICSIQIFPA